MPWRRFILAVACGAVTSSTLFMVWGDGLQVAMSMLMLRAGIPPSVCYNVSIFVMTIVFGSPGFAIALYIATRGPRDPETRCRRCGYILRGIPEPRCPECGERI